MRGCDVEQSGDGGRWAGLPAQAANQVCGIANACRRKTWSKPRVQLLDRRREQGHSDSLRG